MKAIDLLLILLLFALAFAYGNAFGASGEHARICRHYRDLCTEIDGKP